MKTAIELQSFHYAFQISRTIVFEVDYYRCGNNTNKYFTTSAALFNRPKTNFNHCGQAQKELLKCSNAAMNFYKRFDGLHLNDLTQEQYTEILQAIEKLKEKYNWHESEHEIRFNALRELSKMPIKKETSQLNYQTQ